MFIGRIRFDGKHNRQNLYVIWSLWRTGSEVKWKNLQKYKSASN